MGSQKPEPSICYQTPSLDTALAGLRAGPFCSQNAKANGREILARSADFRGSRRVCANPQIFLHRTRYDAAVGNAAIGRVRAGCELMRTLSFSIPREIRLRSVWLWLVV